MNDVQLDTFPSDKREALTMLYLQQQDLSELTPAELVDKYKQTLDEIKTAFKTGKKQQTRY